MDTVGFEPTQPVAGDLQSPETLQRPRVSNSGALPRIRTEIQQFLKLSALPISVEGRLFGELVRNRTSRPEGGVLQTPDSTSTSLTLPTHWRKIEYSKPIPLLGRSV